jgi:hypothetical protein
VLKTIAFALMAGALGVLLVSAVFTPETLPKLPVCSFKLMTGRPCPGCGLTRAFCCISHARFGEAFYFNPFSFAFYAGTLLLAAAPLLVWRFPKFTRWMRDSNFLTYALPGLMATMFLWGLVRMFCGPFV